RAAGRRMALVTSGLIRIAVGYLAATILMWFSTDLTPSTARAIETALSAAAWLAAVPPRFTMPLSSVSTLIFTRLESFSSASLALILVVMTESLTNALGVCTTESAL